MKSPFLLCGLLSYTFYFNQIQSHQFDPSLFFASQLIPYLSRSWNESISIRLGSKRDKFVKIKRHKWKWKINNLSLKSKEIFLEILYSALTCFLGVFLAFLAHGHVFRIVESKFLLQIVADWEICGRNA